MACMQASSRFIDDEKNSTAVIKENVKSHLKMLSVLPHGATPGAPFPQIVVYPEFSIQGAPTAGFTFDIFRKWLKKAAVEIPGDVTDEFAKKSVEFGVYIQACLWEKTEDFPDHYFESVFITDPKGKVVYVRRRAASNPGPITVPGEIYDEYLKKHGPDPVDAFFPVLETPHGVIGGMMCCEMTTPEVTRALVMNGAEIILHSTSEPYGRLIDGRYFRDMERRVRAFENYCFIASANIGSMVNCRMPEGRNRGHSEIIDFRGNTMTMTEAPGEAMVIGIGDIRALRAARRTDWAALSWSALISHVYEQVYANRVMWPHGKRPMTSDGVMDLRKNVLDRLAKKKLVREP